ncbi:type II toxin-antitoxin system HicB family antitoxin [Gammaproteobacteria bacterium]|nr:type II toxin-antitoxin system HicB family antitoxin [Gammaproteobacteria bacterium]
MQYAIAIETGTDAAAYGVVVPDLPGCFSAADELDDVIPNAREAMLLWLEDAVDAGNALPSASSLVDLQARSEFAGWTWALVDIDLADLSTKAVRINITVPERALAAIDKRAAARGMSRSAYLTESALL